MKTFLWKACIGKLPVRGLLSRWSAIPAHCSRCPGELETIDHALFECGFAQEIWNIIRNKWGNLTWPTSMAHFSDLAFTRPRHGIYTAWLLITGSTLWSIWKERNANTFGDDVRPANVIAHLAIASAEELYFLDKAHCRAALLDLPHTLSSWVAPLQGTLDGSF